MSQVGDITIYYGSMGGDCTSRYYITLKKPMTVDEFINEWLTNEPNEWGSFGIDDGKSILGNPRCEYKRGKIVGNSLPDEYLKKKIKEVFGGGGWSCSEFVFKV